MRKIHLVWKTMQNVYQAQLIEGDAYLYYDTHTRACMGY